MSMPPISNLRQGTRLLTGHNADERAIVQSSQDLNWQAFDDSQMAFSVIYTTSQFPADLTNDSDIRAHEETLAKGLGLVNPHGTVLRFVDFAPGYTCMMHRTRSLDYGIVLEGEVDMVLDSGEVHLMKRGDVAVQRATMHAWRNHSEKEWARMIFVLQDCVAPDHGGKALKEEGVEGLSGLLASGN